MKALITILITLSCLTLQAQSFVDIFKIEQNGIPLHTKSDHLEPVQRYAETTIDFIAPIPVSKRIAILSGVQAQRTCIRLTGPSQIKLHAMTLKAGVNLVFNQNVSTSFVLLPRFTGHKRLTFRQMQWGGLILTKQKVSSTFNLKWGAYFSDEQYGPMIVPIGGLFYTNGGFEANLTLPINAEISHDLGTKNYHFGLRFDGINNSYASDQFEPRYIEKKNNELAVFAERKICRWHLRIGAGHSAGRSFTSYSNDQKVALAFPLFKLGDKRAQENQLNANAPFLKASLTYRLPTNN